MSLECCTEQKTFYFTEEEILTIQDQGAPRHVAIIMDGNRRWTKKRQNLSKITHLLDGHWAGAEALLPIVEASVELGIEVLTVYGFSTENWNRPPAEIEMLFHILGIYLKKNRKKMVQQGVRFHGIGDLSFFPAGLQKEIYMTQKETRDGNKIDLVVALNYGGRDDLRRAIVSISKDHAQGKLKQEEITEDLIATYLDTAGWGDPDLLIRTSGEHRVSNFLLWQLAYTELHITDVLWPDFTPRDLLTAIVDFQGRKRRLGS